MIKTACGGCGKSFSAPDNYAGRSAKCPVCGSLVAIPTQTGTTVITATSATSKLETCANCGRGIGRLEKPFVWKNEIVCADCHGILQRQSIQPSVFVPSQTATTPPTRFNVPPTPSSAPVTPPSVSKPNPIGKAKLMLILGLILCGLYWASMNLIDFSRAFPKAGRGWVGKNPWWTLGILLVMFVGGAGASPTRQIKHYNQHGQQVGHTDVPTGEPSPIQQNSNMGVIAFFIAIALWAGLWVSGC